MGATLVTALASIESQLNDDQKVSLLASLESVKHVSQVLLGKEAHFDASSAKTLSEALLPMASTVPKAASTVRKGDMLSLDTPIPNLIDDNSPTMPAPAVFRPLEFGKSRNQSAPLASIDPKTRPISEGHSRSRSRDLATHNQIALSDRLPNGSSSPQNLLIQIADPGASGAGLPQSNSTSASTLSRQDPFGLGLSDLAVPSPTFQGKSLPRQNATKPHSFDPLGALL